MKRIRESLNNLYTSIELNQSTDSSTSNQQLLMNDQLIVYIILESNNSKRPLLLWFLSCEDFLFSCHVFVCKLNTFGFCTVSRTIQLEYKEFQILRWHLPLFSDIYRPNKNNSKVQKYKFNFILSSGIILFPLSR